MKKYAVIVAAGSGQRMNSKIPKQFIQIKGKPVLWYTIQAFLYAFPDIEIILVLPEEYQANAFKLLHIPFNPRIHVTNGGATRFHSVQNGLRLIQEHGVVFIHDGVRCLVSNELINRCYNQALKSGSAIPAVTANDSIRIQDGNTSRSINRNNVKIIQTPQTFLTEILLPAFEQDYDTSFTDEASVVEAAGKKVHLVEGEYSNIKITQPVDLLIIEKMFEEMELEA
ncbi:MAG: 2-C-methyl-D-erythritol 4-phosphate cytidylyltransferase [Chitinophagaceae bacterium]|nr:2-C-methyl-D-erythritol 4-phosphate cytidylyltransferase [Chitinophagaceae bacterium]